MHFYSHPLYSQQMTYKRLKTSDLHISRIAFGCMSLRNSQKENDTLIAKAFENGINYFDTADIYQNGENELAVGKALNGWRQKVVLASKVGNVPKKDGSSGFDWNASKAYILQAIDKSLRRLQTDYIDLYQLHGGTLDDNIDDTIDAFEQLVKMGKIRSYGISSIRPNVIVEYVKRSNIVSVMMQYSLLDRRPEEECFALLEKNNIGVLARGSVASGLLVDKPAKDYLGYTMQEVKTVACAIAQVSGRERNAAQTAIQIALQPSVVAAAVVGIRTQKQLEDAVGAISAPLITKDDLEKLRKSIASNIYEQHRINAR